MSKNQERKARAKWRKQQVTSDAAKNAIKFLRSVGYKVERSQACYPRKIEFDGEKITVRAANAIANSAYEPNQTAPKTWEEIAKISREYFMRVPNCGKKTTDEVFRVLAKRRLNWRYK